MKTLRSLGWTVRSSLGSLYLYCTHQKDQLSGSTCRLETVLSVYLLGKTYKDKLDREPTDIGTVVRSVMVHLGFLVGYLKTLILCLS